MTTTRTAVDVMRDMLVKEGKLPQDELKIDIVARARERHGQPKTGGAATMIAAMQKLLARDGRQG